MLKKRKQKGKIAKKRKKCEFFPVGFLLPFLSGRRIRKNGEEERKREEKKWKQRQQKNKRKKKKKKSEGKRKKNIHKLFVLKKHIR